MTCPPHTVITAEAYQYRPPSPRQPIYATLSDIVVYSPNGCTRAAFALAERFKHAIEAKARERERYGHNYQPVPYNVFVITGQLAIAVLAQPCAPLLPIAYADARTPHPAP